ncbi:MAG: porin [Rhizomicrobium sp.]
MAAPIMAISPSAMAATDGTDAKIQNLQQQLETLQKQIADLKATDSAALETAKKQREEIESRVAETEKKQKSAVTTTLTAGRPTWASADGAFTASIRAVLQADYGYYMQSKAARKLSTGPDLSSGANIRRAQLGLQGKLFGDWSYNFNYDFGNSAYETPGKILNAYLQYDGLGPLAFRFGAFAPSYSVEDQTSATDLMFLERNSPTNMLRSVAGAEGRVGASMIYAGSEIFGALSYTTSKIADTGSFDEQSALVGRLAYLAINEKDAHLLVGGNVIHVFSLPDNYAAGTTTAPMHSITLSDYPEVTVDDNAVKLISTGALAAKQFTSWGVEVAGNYQNFYAQASYNSMEINRSSTYTVFTASGTSSNKTLAVKDNSLSAWYAQVSWVLTGESKPYVPATAAFGSPKPAQPFSLEDGTWGAWELVGRFSDTNLNDRLDDPTSYISAWSGTSKTYSFYNSARGGDQKVYTVGVNWYPNSVVRFALNYMWVDVTRYSATASSTTLPTANIGQKLKVIALRTQLAL